MGAQEIADAPLVDRVQVGVEQADRDRDDLLLRQGPGDLVDSGLVEGRQLAAARVQPLPDLEAQVARHQGPRLLEMDVVERRPDLAADLQHVAEALRGDERGARGLAFDQGVGGDGGAVHEVGDGVRRDAGVGQDAFDRVEEASGGIGGGRGDLRGPGRSAGFGEQDGVGEGAADVHPEAETLAHGGFARARSIRRRSAVRAASIEAPAASITTP